MKLLEILTAALAFVFSSRANVAALKQQLDAKAAELAAELAAAINADSSIPLTVADDGTVAPSA